MLKVNYPERFLTSLFAKYPGNNYVALLTEDHETLGLFLAHEHTDLGYPKPGTLYYAWCEIDGLCHSPKSFDELTL